MQYPSSADQNLINMLLKLLPQDPFKPYINQFAALPYLSTLNWFFPISECLVVMQAWLSAILIYYVYSVILRWVKAIQ